MVARYRFSESPTYPEDEMAEWRLLDWRGAVDSERDVPAQHIRSASQLRALLAAAREDYPGLFVLKGPGDEQLDIGLGGEIGNLSWRDNRTGAAAYAKNDRPPNDDDFEVFVAEGVANDI